MRRFLQSTAIAGAFVASAAIAQAPASQPAPATQPALATQPAPADPSASAGQMSPSAAGGAAAAAATPAAGGGVTAGAQVKGPEGNPVGTIESVDAQYATLATPNVKVKLPLTAFAQRPDGLVIGMTQAQLEAAAGSAGAAAAAPQQSAAAGGAPAGAAAAAGAPSGAAAAPAKLEAGATVSDTKGAPVGKIEEVSGEFAVVATAKNKVRLPLTAFATTQSGPVIGMSEAELDAAAEAAKPQTAAK